MTVVPDIVDVFVGTPLGTSDQCSVSCGHRVEQSEPEYNIRSTTDLLVLDLYSLQDHGEISYGETNHTLRNEQPDW